MGHDSGVAAGTYDELLARLLAWARGEDNVRAVLVLGSRARGDNTADQWADLDLLLVVNDPLPILSKTEWLDSISPHLLTFVEPTAVAGQFESRVLFEGMYDMDVSVVPVGIIGLLANDPPRELLFDVFGRGHRLMLDKDGLEVMLSSVLSQISKRPDWNPPSREEYLQVVNDFLYHVVWTAKHLRRGELFWAKRGLDCHLTPLLLKMLEWHAKAMHGQEYDTWFRGRFLERWADPRATSALRNASARYEEAELGVGLSSQFTLFQWVAMETSERLNLAYPRSSSQKIADWLGHNLKTRESPSSRE